LSENAIAFRCKFIKTQNVFFEKNKNAEKTKKIVSTAEFEA